MIRVRWNRAVLAPAARVAAVATLLIAVVYVVVVGVLDMIVYQHLVWNADARIEERLHHAAAHDLGSAQGRSSTDLDDAPVLLWRVGANGHPVALSADTPTLASDAWSHSGPTTATVGTTQFRLAATRSGTGWLVAGQSLAQADHVRAVLLAGEAIAGPVLLVSMFLGSVVIGVQASSPVELARRRQLEFTADASHELRTPLSVIDAELSLARATPRRADEYRQALDRIGGESQRLRQIVEDLLWLARFDSEPPPPGDEPVDLATIAVTCADRFGSVAQSRGVEITVRSEGQGPAWIDAPPEWVDRLAGVLVDNACRHAGPGGSVRILVDSQGHRVSLAVEDSGPGITPEERPRLFDRFHRATAGGGGAGLGLAIADSVVRSTAGRWTVGDAAIGGARMEVSWHRSHVRAGQADDRGAPPPPQAPEPSAPAAGQRARRR